MDDSAEDQRMPHHRNPPEYVSLKKLAGTLTTDFTSLKYTPIHSVVMSFFYLKEDEHHNQL